jgi:hypothetical protein
MEAENPTPAPDIPPDLRGLLEYAAERLNLGVGDVRFEVILADGRFRYLFRHERLDRQQIERL